MIFETNAGGNNKTTALRKRNKRILRLNKSGMSYIDISRLFFSHGVRLSPQRVGEIVRSLKAKEKKYRPLDKG
jgi:pyruvate kinase